MKKIFASILVALDGMTTTYARRTGVAILAAVVLSAGMVCAQSTSGNIVGTVADPTGALVPNAQVVATNTQTSVQYPTTANGNGEYRLANLPPGIYNVSVSAPGFTSKSAQGFEVQLNRTSTLLLQLAQAGVSSTVEVTAEAGAALDTTTVQLQQTFSNQELSELPTATVGLGVLNVSLLSPNVATSGGIGAGTGPSVGGQRVRSNNFTIEGVDNNDKGVTGPLVYIPNDAVGEFTLITNQFSPEFGHSTGGQFNTTVLSGTNKFHGRAYEFFQNRNLNAIDTVIKNATATGVTPKNPRYDFNRYGGQFGGPIKRDRLFFFANYERQTTGQGFAYAVCTPTAAGFATLNGLSGGDISATNLAIVDKYVPVSPDPQVTGGVDDAACFNTASGPQVATVTDATGNPINIPLGNFQVNAPNTINFKVLTTSGDWTISSSDSFRLRYLYNNFQGVDFAANLPAFFQPLPVLNHLVALSEFHNFSPNLTNEVRLGFSRFSQTLVAGNFTFPGLDVFPNLTFFDFGQLNVGADGNAPQATIQNLYQFTDNISWVKGAHTLKFGFDGRKYIAPQTFTQRGRGDYQYAVFDEYLHDLAPDSLVNVGQRSTGNFTYYGDQTALYGYANDTWRIRPNVTLNYGMRYEFTSVPVGERTQALNAAASVPGLINFHAPTPQYKNFAPRIGIDYAPNDKTSVRAGFGMAYDVLFDNLGLLSFPPQFSATQDVGSAGQPDYLSPHFLANGGLHPGTGTLATFPDIAAQRAATANFIPDQKLPYSESYSLGVQHVFGSNYTAEVRYLGTRGIHLPAQTLLNIQHVTTPSNSLPTDLTGSGGTNPQSGSTFTLANVKKGNGQLIDNGDGTFTNAAQLVPAFFNAGFFNKMTAFRPVAQSDYNALSGSLIRRFRDGLQLDLAYTWSKTMDDATAETFSTVLTPRRPFDSQNVAGDYSRSALDRTHRLTLEAIYELPFYKGSSNWLLKNIVSNWELSPVYTYQSPEYGTVESTTNPSLSTDSAATSRVIINPSGKPGTSSTVTAVINPALGPCPANPNTGAIPRSCDGNTVGYSVNDPTAYYIQAKAGALANSGRNTLPVRPTNNVDATAVKRINITERYAFEFQAQAFNVLNHHQFVPGSLNTINSLGDNSGTTQSYLTVGSGNFNNPEATFSSQPRVMQLALKFIF